MERKTIHLKEEELISSLPERIGKVILDYSHYPGEDFYSDGVIEDEILDIVRNYSRVEYQRIIEERNSWPILYHLSALRSNIIDWLPIGPGDKVLEIGSGCGAITEKLAEKAGSVTCVELSAKRSHINACRNQDKGNIKIHVGNFSDIEAGLAEDYDYVLLIGVFEYGNSYIHTDSPYEDFLKILLRHKKPEGRLVIAIENRLGLKYFAGCQEDHIGSYFGGIENYPEGGSGARTFSRPGLCKILESCGVSEYHFYYPYPDYKFPTVLYSDERLPFPGELTDNLRNFDRDRMLLFNEKYAYDSLIKDGLFTQFSNSFLVILGSRPPVVYAKYSNDRSETYKLKTELVEEKGKLTVRKTALSEGAEEHVRQMEESCRLLKERYAGGRLHINPCTYSEEGKSAIFPFENGCTLEELMDQRLEKNDLDGFYALFDEYLERISYGEESGITDYDMIFANILVDKDAWNVIDYEWTIRERIPVREIAFRAIYCYVLEEEKRTKIDLDVIFDKLGITDEDVEEYREKEKAFQKKVTGKRKSMGELRAGIGTYAIDVKKLAADYLQDILDKRIQIYPDFGNGFSEATSYYMPDVYLSKHYAEAEIAFDGNVKQLRIDPADRPCAVKIIGLSINDRPVPLQKKYVAANGKTLDEGVFVFADADPNITFFVSQLPIQGENRLGIKFEIVFLPEGIAGRLTENKKKWFSV